MTEHEAKEVSAYIAYQVKISAGEGSPTPLNPHNTMKLENHLFEKTVKAIERHDPTISPLIPFLKMVIKIEAKRQAARLFDKQIKRGEHPAGDLSIDGTVSPEEGETFADLLGEPDHVVRRREIRRDVNETLLRLTIRERIALESLMYSDVTKERTAFILGITRPTLDRFLKEEAIPHFIEVWNGLGKKLR